MLIIQTVHSRADSRQGWIQKARLWVRIGVEKGVRGVKAAETLWV